MSFTIRLAMLDRYVAPPSGDFGNFLTQANVLMGHDVIGQGLRYPPLYFLIQIPFIDIFGPMMGLKVLQAIVGTSCIVPFFLLAERRTEYGTAVVVTILFSFYQTFAEMTAWGGGPNFLAITFMLFAFYLLDDAYVNERSWKRDGILIGVLVGLIFETHHLTTVVMLGTLGLFLLFMLIWSNRERRTKTLKIAMLIAPVALIVSAPAIPIYLRMEADLASTLGAYHIASFTELFSINGGAILYLFSGPYWFAWIFVFSLGIMAMTYALISRREPRAYYRLVTAAGVAPLILGLFVFSNAAGRILAFLPIPMMLATAVLVAEFLDRDPNRKPMLRITFPSRKFMSLAIVALLVLLSVTGIQWMSGAVDWYHPVEGGEKMALDWISQNTPSDAVFATSGKSLSGHKEGDRLAWWIEGYAGRTAVLAGSEKFRLFKDEIDMARDMNRFFAGTHIFENGYLQASDNFPIEYRGNPEVAVRSEGVYEPAFFLNDAMHNISYFDNASSTTPEVETLYGAVPGAMIVTESKDRIITNATYTTSHLRLTRSMSMSNRSGDIDIGFRITAVGETVLEGLTINVFCPHGSEFSDVSVGAESSFVVDGPWRLPTDVSMSIQEDVGTLANCSYAANENQGWGLPKLVYMFNPESNSFNVTFHFRIGVKELDTKSPLAHYDAYDILRKYHVDFLFESVTMGLEVERFAKDSCHFSVVYRNNAVEIVKVTV